MNKLQYFAKSHLDIELTKHQLEFIEAWTDDKVVYFPRRMGITTANKVIKAYLKDSLEQPPKQESN